ncbi:hypothetical protein [Carnimonas nigrificans]|uniref:hypothetical protein n=1 Tax=Carnimonas nigrificans TaxID=64323 RepID=UPI0012EB38DC|nr:hypothetical protein [Carnimonas nigrificans]
MLCDISNEYRVTRPTARTDLKGLAALNLLRRFRQGNRDTFVVPDDLGKRIQFHGL